jgi:putative SbcD/Mre11-related phosphoesterase
MKLTEDIQIKDLALWLKKEKTLVIADLHLGFEENLHRQGVLVPWFQFKEIKKRLEKIFSKTKPEKIIINGDLKHEFGSIPQQEWDEVKGIIDFLQKNSKELILVKGNHDKILGPIANYKKVKLKDSVTIRDTIIMHGHELSKIPEKIKTIIIAHEHPALGLTDGTTTELYKCFLKGTYAGKTLIVQPSFCLATEGTDVLKENVLSPFLKQSLLEFEAWTILDKVRYFGKLKNLHNPK